MTECGEVKKFGFERRYIEEGREERKIILISLVSPFFIIYLKFMPCGNPCGSLSCMKVILLFLLSMSAFFIYHIWMKTILIQYQ